MPRTRRRSRGSARGSARTRTSTLNVSQFRLRAGFVLIAMVLSIFGARLVQLQAVDPQHYATLAAKEGTVSVVLPAERGDILDRNGQPLADSIDGLMVVADPAVTADKAPEIASFLSQRLDLDYFTTLQKLRVKDSRFQYIARRVPSTLATDVLKAADARGYKGLSSRRDPVRTYPGHDVAANIVGFVGTDEAFGGLEQTFNTWLSGKDGSARYEVGAGNEIPLGHNSSVPAVNGKPLHTTIDRDLDWYSLRVLRQAVQESKSDSGMAVIMDSRTGELLSIADYPTFDADDPAGSAPDPLDRGARSINLAYEPGSVEKVLTLSSLIDAGKVTDRTKLLVPGSLARDGTVIHDYWPHGLIKLTLAGVLAKSSNIGTVLASDRFGQGQLRSYLDKYGLGVPTNIGVEPETKGILPDPTMWTNETEDRIDFGQSLSVNAIQMAAAINTIANHGVRIDPSLIQGVAVNDQGQRIGSGVATERRVVSRKAAKETTLMMERTVDPIDGVAPKAQVPGYTVAGKTGTAQRVGPECGCYDGSYTVSFAGFAPAENPRFTIYVVLQNPKVAGAGGGATAGPVFSKLMAYTLQRYGVPPSNKQQPVLPVTW